MGSGAERRLDQGKTHSKVTMSRVQCLHFCSPVLEDTSLGESAQIIPLITAFKSSYSESHSYHMISKYEQSDWFSRLLSQQAQDFGKVCTHLLHREGGGLGIRL